MADNPSKPAAEVKPDSPHVANLKAKRQALVDKITRVAATPETRDHDHDQVLKRCRDGIAELDREIKESV